MKIIFLDIDGVLNCEKGYKDGFCKYIGWTNKNGKEDHHQSFYPPAKILLNKLIEETNAKIVISSSWRHSGLEYMRGVWEQEGMSGEIIDITPSIRYTTTTDNMQYSSPRGCEIDCWLENIGKFGHINWSKETQLKYMESSGISNYIIIDDDGDMLYHQRHHFIHVLPSPRNKEGFNDFYYNIALEKLSKTVIDLNYVGDDQDECN